MYRSSASLFDHLVGAGEERFGDCQAERLGGLKVYVQSDLCRLFDRKLRRPCALEDAINIASGTLPEFEEIRRVEYRVDC